jgi:hypothetical protein
VHGWEAVVRLGLVATLALGACSFGDDSASPESSPERRAEDRLRAALLTVGDLPDGWQEIEISYTAVDACPMRTEMIAVDRFGELPKYTAAFAAEDRAFADIPDAFELLVPAPPEMGPGILREAHRSLGLCGGGGEVDGYRYVTDDELPLPTYGDESTAWRVTIEELDTGESHGVNAIYGRHGDLIVGVGVIEPEGETRHIERLATLAFERASAVG